MVSQKVSEPTESLPEDASLVTAALSGNTAAFARLVQKYQALAISLAVRIVGDYADGQEVAQDAFVRAYENLGKLQHPAAFKSWLCQMVYRLALNRERYNQRRGKSRTESLFGVDYDDQPLEICIPTPAPSPRRVVSTREQAQLVEQALAEIAEPWRTVLILREIQELSYVEIGDIMGIPAGTVKSRLHEGRRKLADKLQPLLKELWKE